MVLSAIPAGVPAQVDEGFVALVQVGAHDDPIHLTDALWDSDPENGPANASHLCSVV